MLKITPVRIPKINFDMPITDLIMELEMLRYKELRGTTSNYVFQQMRYLFQMLESIGSSRIEGNNTTIMDYVETAKLNNESAKFSNENILEIANIEKAMQYVEQNISDMRISLHFIRELHCLVVNRLNYRKEGALHPGDFRKDEVRINGSSHVPPDPNQVLPLMEELVDFINEPMQPKYDLVKIAIAHHRFVWIHPFENGNGRVVRLFTYALLLKNVFCSKGRIINPTAVFCSNRNAYYTYLGKADNGTDKGLIEWITYMLNGLKNEIQKIDKLTDYKSLREIILKPALLDAFNNQWITKDEYVALNVLVNKEDQILKSIDLSSVMPQKNSSERSRLIRRMIDKNLIMPTNEKSRTYMIIIGSNILTRSVLLMLDKNGFLPENIHE